MSLRKNWLEDWFSGSEKNALIERLKSEDSDLADLVKAWCNKIRVQLDIMSSKNFEQYTGHGSEHSDAMLMCLGWLVPPDVIDDMNGLEIALLVLAVYHHDIGMAFDLERKADLMTHPDWLAARDVLIEKFRRSPTVDDKSDSVLEQLAFVEWARKRHTEESVYWIRTHRKGNPDYRLGPRYHDYDPWEDIIELCRIHTEPSCDELETAKCGPALSGILVNMCFLGCALRLADECHITVDRADEQMAKFIRFSDDFSRLKWRERQCVPSVGHDPNNRLLVIRANPPSADFHRAVVSMGREIRDELERTNMTLERKNSPYRFPWFSVDFKSQVKEGPEYNYRDWEYSLNRSKVYDLLMGKNLYADDSVCIRELLQNAVDAVWARWGSEAPKEGRIACRRLVKNRDDHDFEVIEVEDNGIGMDDDIVENHLLKVPAESFYRTSRYMREHPDASKVLIPIAQHGIGFLSNFMVAKTVEIFTQYYSPGKRAREIHAELVFPLDKGVVYYKTPLKEFPEGVRNAASGTCVRLWLTGKLTDWTRSDGGGKWNNLSEIVKHWARRVIIPISIDDFSHPFAEPCDSVAPANAIPIRDDAMGINGYIDMNAEYDPKGLQVTVAGFYVERHPFMKEKLGLWFPKGELDFSGKRDFSLTVDRNGFQVIETSNTVAKARSLLFEAAIKWTKQQRWTGELDDAKKKFRKLLKHVRVLDESKDLRDLVLDVPLFKVNGEETHRSISEILKIPTYFYIPVWFRFKPDIWRNCGAARRFYSWYQEIIRQLWFENRILFSGEMGPTFPKEDFAFASRSKHLQRYPLHLISRLCDAKLDFKQGGWPLIRLLPRSEATPTHGWSWVLDYEPDKKDWLICSTDGEAYWINPHCLAKKEILGNEGKIIAINLEHFYGHLLAKRPADGFLYPYDKVIIYYELDGKRERTQRTVGQLGKINDNVVYPFDRIDFWVWKFIDEEHLSDEDVHNLLRVLRLDPDSLDLAR